MGPAWHAAAAGPSSSAFSQRSPAPWPMTVFNRRPALRWIVPVVLALVLAGGGAAVGALTAVARGGLPPRTAAQLLVDVQQAR